MDKTDITTGLKYRPDIDGLRAIAVMSVIGNHAELGFPGGFVGVDVFYVISGYLITALVLKDLSAERFSLIDFWARRIRRILPALLMMVFATLATGWFLLLPDDYVSLAQSAVSVALVSSNIHFANDTGYFQQSADVKPLLHTWSLGVEEQFYFVLPVVLFFLARWRRLHFGPLLLAGAAIASFAGSIVAVQSSPVAAFYLLPYRFWEIGLGALLAFAPARPLLRSSLGRELAGVLGLLLVIAPCFAYSRSTPFPGIAALPPVAGTAILIFLGTGSPRPLIHSCLSCRPLAFVGLISYSLYLWHWPVFAFAKYSRLRPWFTWQERVFLVVVGVCLAMLSWKFVEVPFRRRLLLDPRRRWFLFGSTGLAGVLLAGSAILIGEGIPTRLSAEAIRYAETGRADPSYTPNLEPSDVPHHLPGFGDPTGPVEILIWGDSHAMGILPAIDALCRERRIRACVATHAGTAPALHFFQLEVAYSLRERAPEFAESVVAFVRNSRIRVVVLAARWESYGVDPRFEPAITETIDTLVASGVKVFFVRDVPRYSVDVSQALVFTRLFGANCDALRMSVEEYDAQQQCQTALDAMLRDRGIEIIDPIPVLLRKSQSRSILPFDEYGSYYVDADHLSTHGALAIRDAFIPIIEAACQPED
jgi:peptidoglycan/LPS O-acetylase OafA/YrhL